MGLAQQLQEIAGLARCDDVPRKQLHHELTKLARRVQLEESPFITVTAAAERWGMCRKELRKRIRSGEIPTKEIAGCERIDLREIDAENF